MLSSLRFPAWAGLFFYSAMLLEYVCSAVIVFLTQETLPWNEKPLRWWQDVLLRIKTGTGNILWDFDPYCHNECRSCWLVCCTPVMQISRSTKGNQISFFKWAFFLSLVSLFHIFRQCPTFQRDITPRRVIDTPVHRVHFMLRLSKT